jgi:hypothetical protein
MIRRSKAARLCVRSQARIRRRKRINNAPNSFKAEEIGIMSSKGTSRKSIAQNAVDLFKTYVWSPSNDRMPSLSADQARIRVRSSLRSLQPREKNTAVSIRLDQNHIPSFNPGFLSCLGWDDHLTSSVNVCCHMRRVI